MVPKWPNFTQAVEEEVKVMNEACTEVTGYSARDGCIKQRLISMKIMSHFCTKGNFNINLY